MPAISAPVVTNVHGEQRPDTHLVDVYYDLADADSSSVSVRLQVSADGGDNWTVVPVVNVTQAVGENVTPGHGKHILWNAGADWDGQVSKAVMFKVMASDTAPAPDGFALIPAGSFQMGDQSSPLVGYSSELPVHTVTVSGFYMAKYETTKELWDEVRAWGMAAGRGYTDLAAGNGSVASKGANHPVHSITWYDMVKWCNARSEKENLTPCYTVSGATYKAGQNSAVVCNWSANGYRLPSEAEWEKAARGGLSAQNFPWGNTITHSQANYNSSSSYAYDVSPTRGYHPIWGTGAYPYTSPVGSFAPNGYGLYDMSGNLWEWCWDWFGGYTAGSQTDPRGPASGSNRVRRGGGWYGLAFYCRVAYRFNYGPLVTPYFIGFRIARSSVP